MSLMYQMLTQVVTQRNSKPRFRMGTRTKRAVDTPRLRRERSHHEDIASQFLRALESVGISQSELARRVGVPRAGISRDLRGGLNDAKLPRLRRLAEAIGYDVKVVIRRMSVAKDKARR